MVSRIEVIPTEVRGYGNIVEAKSLSDFVPVGSELSFSENIYTLTALEGLRITLTASQSSISYGSSVSLSATVVDNDEPVTGVSVTFYDGSTSLGSATTNSSGVATYTTSSLTVGSHTCTATYDDKTSNSVSVTVNKLASTISLTVPASGTVGTAYTITGTLVPSSGSVKLYENGSLKDTLTVSSGSFSKSITQNSEGTYSYYAVFEGSSTYESATSSIQSITVEAIPVPSYNGVSLSSNKSILSYADSESATLTAQLLDGSTPVSASGVTVEFFKGSTSLGTASTNASGVATKTYASTGGGDLSLTAKVDSYESSPVTVEDCYLYDTAGTDKLSSYTKTASLTATHDSDHYVLTSGSANQFLSVLSDADNVRFEMDMKLLSNSDLQGLGVFDRTNGFYNNICLTRSATVIKTFRHSNNSYTNLNSINHTNDTGKYYHCILEKNGSDFVAKVYDGDTSLYSYSTSKSFSTTYFNIYIASASVTIHVKNIKIKVMS